MTPLERIAAPKAPSYRVFWEALQTFPWIQELGRCPQDPQHHAEGNVWIHTRMVLDALVALPAWRELCPADQQVVYWACLLHDVAKPVTTRMEDGKLRSKGHSRRGEGMARRILWEIGVPFAQREEVCRLVRYHQVPFFLIQDDDPQRKAIEISLGARNELLGIVAEADIRGRISGEIHESLDKVEFFREFCREEGCYRGPKLFCSPYTRYAYFHQQGRHPDVEAWDDSEVNVMVMSGLPGSGKDTYIQKHFPSLPVLSMDGLREELDIDARDNQGPVVQAAKERAKEYLRRREGFVWNATNISRLFRSPLLSLMVDYRAKVQLVYVEVPYEQLWKQNRSRAAVVPGKAIQAMLGRWDVPDVTEAHEVIYAV